MQKVFLDFEMNSITKRQSAKLDINLCEIIQIGAVKLGDKNQISERFISFVKPKFQRVTPITTRVTGIRNGMVKNAPELEGVLAKFTRWLGNDVQLFTWSQNDQLQFQREITYKKLYPEGIPSCFETWIDLQQVYVSSIGLSGGIGLKRALEQEGLEFSGKEHSALADAENTARLFSTIADWESFYHPRPLPSLESRRRKYRKRTKKSSSGKRESQGNSIGENTIR